MYILIGAFLAGFLDFVILPEIDRQLYNGEIRYNEYSRKVAVTRQAEVVLLITGVALEIMRSGAL